MTMDKFDDNNGKWKKTDFFFSLYVLMLNKIFILVFMNLNRALHCNQMIIHVEREKEKTHTYTKEKTKI
jgi:hypothetical protein